MYNKYGMEPTAMVIIVAFNTTMRIVGIKFSSHRMDGQTCDRSPLRRRTTVVADNPLQPPTNSSTRGIAG